MAKKYSLRNVEIFSTGEHRDKAYTEADLDDMVRNFGAKTGGKVAFHVPSVIGHDEDGKWLQDTGLPAAGWVSNPRNIKGKLVVDIDDIPPQIARLLKGKAYRTVSAEVYDSPPKGHPGKGKMLRRVAFLGGEIPQVKNLSELPDVEESEAFSEEQIRTLRLNRIVPSGGNRYAVFSEVVRNSERDPHPEMGGAWELDAERAKKSLERVGASPVGHERNRATKERRQDEDRDEGVVTNRDWTTSLRKFREARRAMKCAEPTEFERDNGDYARGLMAQPEVGGVGGAASGEAWERRKAASEASEDYRADLMSGADASRSHARTEAANANEVFAEPSTRDLAKRAETDMARRRDRVAETLPLSPGDVYQNKDVLDAAHVAADSNEAYRKALTAPRKFREARRIAKNAEPVNRQSTRDESGWGADRRTGYTPSESEASANLSQMLRNYYDSGSPAGSARGNTQPQGTQVKQHAEENPTHEGTIMSRDELLEKLATHGIDTAAVTDAVPDSLLAEFIRILDANESEETYINDPDSEPLPEPGNDDEMKAFAERAEKMGRRAARYFEKYKKGGAVKDEAKVEKHNCEEGKDAVHVDINSHKGEKAAAYSESAIAEIVENRLKALLPAANGDLARMQKFAEQQVANQKKLLVETFCEVKCKEGKITPAELDPANPANIKDRLMRADSSAIVQKFKEGGQEVALTELDLQMKEIEGRKPFVFGERFVQPLRKSGDVDSEVQQIEDHFEIFSELFQKNGMTKERLVEGFKLEKKARPSLTAREYIGA